MKRCYVCGADQGQPCQAIDGEIAECPRPSPAFRRFREQVQAEVRQIMRARDFNAVEQGDEE